MRQLLISFWVIWIFSNISLAGVSGVDEVRLKELAYSSYWLRLLHYEKSLWGGYKSRVVGPDFFLSQNGSTEPLDELKSDILAFSQNLEIGRFKQHPQCAFPERFRFLKEKLGLEVVPVPCPKFEQYIERFDAESVTLVFSSAYPHNPGSMFGHTFLRINKKVKDGEKHDLLDWGISYAAQVADDENGFAFVFLGLTGGYPGEFSLLPYYAKVNEYVNTESRDLWEYELNLNREETYRLLRNIWEVETNGYFKYYFLDENCAYQLLSFLEVAKPEWDLTDFPIYVIPGETVKKIAKISGAIKSIKYRPSLQKKLIRHYSLLEPSQREAFTQIIDAETKVSEVKDPKVLDQVAEYLLYLKKKKEDQLSQVEKQLFRETLVERSKIASLGPTPLGSENLMDASRPDLAHDTYRLGISSGFEDRNFLNPRSQWFQELHFKFAFHDLLNSDLGYTPFSQLDFPGFTIRFYNQSEQLRFENIHFLSLTSLSPLKPLEKHLSWSFHFERLSPKDLVCDHCQVFHFDGGVGGTLGVGDRDGVIYSLLMPQLELGSSLKRGFRFVPKWQVGAILNFSDFYKVQALGNLVWDIFQETREPNFFDLQLNHSYALGKSWDFRLTTQAILLGNSSPRFYEGKLALNYYF